jgi:putative intracellular protease/amidase
LAAQLYPSVTGALDHAPVIEAPEPIMKIPALTLVAIAAALVTQYTQAGERKPADVRVGILMFDGVQIIDFAAPYEVFGQAGYTVDTVSVDGKPIETTMGLKVTPDMSLADAPRFDVVVVPGGRIDAIAKDKQAQQWLQSRAKQAEVTLSVCTGSFVLASSGLLDDLAATTFYARFDALATAAPRTKIVRDARWVDTGRIVTSAGLSSGIDASLHVVERLSGAERARTVALNLEYDWDREQGFVRGLMADRYIDQRAPLQWPEGSRLERVLGFGDRTHWKEQYRITATAPIERYVQAIAAGYDEQRGWTTESAGNRRLLLRKNTEQGGDVLLRVAAEPGQEPNIFNIDVSIEVRPH